MVLGCSSDGRRFLTNSEIVMQPEITHLTVVGVGLTFILIATGSTGMVVLLY